MLWLAYHATGESELRTKAEALLPSFAKRLEERIDMSHPRDGPPPRHIDIAAAGRRRPGWVVSERLAWHRLPQLCDELTRLGDFLLGLGPAAH